MPDPTSHEPPGHQAWQAIRRAHSRVSRAIETELLTAQRLSLPAYTLLTRLADTPRRRLRMSELAEAVMLSRAGVTRLVDRLEHDGLVIRGGVHDDGRGVAVFVTNQGLQHQREAFATYQQAVARHFTHGLTDTDLTILRRISQQLADTAPAPAPRQEPSRVARPRSQPA